MAGTAAVLFRDGHVRTITRAVERRGRLLLIDTLGGEHPATSAVTYTPQEHPMPTDPTSTVTAVAADPNLSTDPRVAEARRLGAESKTAAEAAAARARAETAAEYTARRAAIVRELVAEGHPITAIAEAFELSRGRLYQLLDSSDASTGTRSTSREAKPAPARPTAGTPKQKQ